MSTPMAPVTDQASTPTLSLAEQKTLILSRYLPPSGLAPWRHNNYSKNIVPKPRTKAPQGVAVNSMEHQVIF